MFSVGEAKLTGVEIAMPRGGERHRLVHGAAVGAAVAEEAVGDVVALFHLDRERRTDRHAGITAL